MAISLPTPEQVRQRRKAKNRAATRRKHYVDRIKAAPTRRQQMAEAFDYLRAALADRPDAVHEKVILDVIEMADWAGEIQ